MLRDGEAAHTLPRCAPSRVNQGTARWTSLHKRGQSACFPVGDEGRTEGFRRSSNAQSVSRYSHCNPPCFPGYEVPRWKINPVTTLIW
jgi:hypothetical protein